MNGIRLFSGDTVDMVRQKRLARILEAIDHSPAEHMTDDSIAEFVTALVASETPVVPTLEKGKAIRVKEPEPTQTASGPFLAYLVYVPFTGHDRVLTWRPTAPLRAQVDVFAVYANALQFYVGRRDVMTAEELRAEIDRAIAAIEEALEHIAEEIRDWDLRTEPLQKLTARRDLARRARSEIESAGFTPI